MKYFFLLLFFISLISCNSFIKVIMGFHNPRIETKESIIKYGIRKKIWNQYYFVKKDSLGVIFKGFFPQVYFYDRNAMLCSVDNCFALLKETTINVIDSNKISFYDGPLLSTHLNRIQNNIGKDIFIDARLYDYTVVFYWAKFLGILNKNRFSWMVQHLKKTNKKVRIIAINCDLQKEWNLTEFEFNSMIK
jgi:hypothetical protein